MTDQSFLSDFELPSNFTSENTLIVALRGWNDAGESASSAVAELQQQLTIERVIHRIDDEDFFDYSVTRPRVELSTENVRKIRWPETTLYGQTVGRLFVLTGVEPSFRWRRYCTELVMACEQAGITNIVLVGALLADAPHTRDIQVYLSSDDARVRKELEVEASSYEGPTGVLTAISERARHAGIRTLSMWASVPHYAQTPEMSNPKATLAIVQELSELLGIEVDTGQLRENSKIWEGRISEAVAGDAELRGYVEYLEQTRDVVDSEAATGDAIAAEFERFLANGHSQLRGSGHPTLGEHSADADDPSSGEGE